MSSLVAFSFGTKDIRVTDRDGGSWFILRDLLEAMESKTTTTNALESVKQGLGEGYSGEIPLQTAGGVQQAIIVAESAATFLLSRSNTDKGRELNRFIHIEVLPSIRKTGGYQVKAKPRQNQNPQFAVKMAIARAAKSMLRMSDTSAIRMLASIAESEGVEPSFLPAYVDEPLTRAITPMLKGMGHDLGGHAASVVNPALAEMGILEHLERIGSRGQIKKFWSLTAAGLQYGRNETNPSNPRQTIPLFYVDRFPELLSKLEAHIEARPRTSNVVLVSRGGPKKDGSAA